MMPTHCIVDAEKDANMKSLSQKEAIAILNDMKIDTPLPKAAVTQRKRNMALDMAISAMSCSEFPNSSDTDTISRQSAIDALDKRFDSIPMEQTTEILQLRRDLRQLPSAQPKRGRGISADAMFGGVPLYCSECGENTRDTVMGKPRWNFCPNCGAKMEVTE